jgi:hypothetical protein
MLYLNSEFVLAIAAAKDYNFHQVLLNYALHHAHQNAERNYIKELEASAAPK